MLEIDPHLTENFLRSLPEVVEAYAWIENGRLIAQVTVFDEIDLSPRALQVACKVELGQKYTPGYLTLIRAKKRAA
ncbi:MAG TPA: hypothetical protein VGL56_20635 [Fimbriimonadaceae bacterium]|jgi:hypothetical protein